MVKSGLALLAAMLLSAVCLAQDAPARPTATSSRLKAPVTVSAAGEEFFSQPSVEESLQRILHPEKITHRKPFELGTAFRTLGEAAQAGINPLAASDEVSASPSTIKVSYEGEIEDQALWPVIVGGASLIAVGFILFVFALTLWPSRKSVN